MTGVRYNVAFAPPLGYGKKMNHRLFFSPLLLLAACATSAPPRRSHSPDFSKAKVTGRLPPEVIQQIVRANFGGMRTCYERGLARDAGLQGKISVGFIILPDGSVTATGSDSDFRDPEVVDCVVEKFSHLVFPNPEGGSVKVIYPLIFSPGD